MNHPDPHRRYPSLSGLLKHEQMRLLRERMAVLLAHYERFGSDEQQESGTRQTENAPTSTTPDSGN